MPDNGMTRLDRIEQILENSAKRIDALGLRLDSMALRHQEVAERMNQQEQRQDALEDDFARLLKAQVVMVDTVDKLGQRVDKLSERMDRYIERIDRHIERIDAYIENHKREHSEIEERFSALMRMMDEWIRSQPRPGT